METDTIEGCGALIFCRKTKRHLFLLRSKKRQKHSWGLAGGRVESQERVVDALRRELIEEMEFDVGSRRIKPVEKFTSDDGKFVYHTFMVVVDDEFVPKLNHEHVGYCWVPLDNYPKPLHPGVWRTFKFESVVRKIRTLERL